MSIYFEVKVGPNKGKQLPITEDAIVGRRKADILLKDDKVSSQHAKIYKNNKGQWILKDLGSRNGIKLQGKKKSEILLTHGVEIQIGRTLLVVVEAEESTFVGEEAKPVENITPVKEKKTERPQVKPAPVKQEPKKVEPAKWNDSLSEICDLWASKKPGKAQPVYPLKPVLLLDFIRGVQTDTQWTLGFGPRTAGQKSVDLPIYEDQAPDECFEFRPTQKGVEFFTKHPKTILLNDQPISSDVVNDGDIISINETLIRISFVNE